LSDIDLAYIAGFFDGEGCISLGRKKDGSYRRHYTYQLVVTVSNTKPEILEFLHRHFGGHFRKIKNPSTKNGKTVYVWALLCRKALNFIKTIYPYLKLKKRQAELAIKFYTLVNPYGCNKYDPEKWKQKDLIYNELKALNKRGI